MPDYGLLAVDALYELEVKEIYERQGTPFIGKYDPHKGKTLFCHHFYMQDEDGIVYKCQVCEPKDTQNWCNVGDTMQFIVKAFTREIHTIEFQARDGQPIRVTTHIPGPDMQKQKTIGSGIIPKEISAFLSPKSIALISAAIFFSNRHENRDENGTVINKAKEFEKYLTE